jgi:hypothetical protein
MSQVKMKLNMHTTTRDIVLEVDNHNLLNSNLDSSNQIKTDSNKIIVIEDNSLQLILVVLHTIFQIRIQVIPMSSLTLVLVTLL